MHLMKKKMEGSVRGEMGGRKKKREEEKRRKGRKEDINSVNVPKQMYCSQLTTDVSLCLKKVDMQEPS